MNINEMTAFVMHCIRHCGYGVGRYLTPEAEESVKNGLRRIIKSGKTQTVLELHDLELEFKVSRTGARWNIALV